MNPAVKQLIPAIASFAKEKEAYLSKTKLLKLLYLFDVEYYRLHRTTFTGFPWKFFHLGPWTNEFDPVLEELVGAGELISRPSSRHDYDSMNYLPAEPREIGPLFTSFRDEGVLNRVLNVWVERSVGEILDYVYFHTEPMENGVRNTPLDFSVIPSQQPERYARTASNTPPGVMTRMRQEFKERQAQLQVQQFGDTEFTPPRYDDEFFQAMSKLEENSA